MTGRRGLLIAAIVAIATVALALVLAAAVSGPRHPSVHVEPQVTFTLPPASTGCGGATALQGGATQVPLTVSTARHPYRMMVAHHRSALRFTFRTTKGWRRAALPLAAVVLGARMAMATVRLALSR